MCCAVFTRLCDYGGLAVPNLTDFHASFANPTALRSIHAYRAYQSKIRVIRQFQKTLQAPFLVNNPVERPCDSTATEASRQRIPTLQSRRCLHLQHRIRIMFRNVVREMQRHGLTNKRLVCRHNNGTTWKSRYFHHLLWPSLHNQRL